MSRIFDLLKRAGELDPSLTAMTEAAAPRQNASEPIRGPVRDAAVANAGPAAVPAVTQAAAGHEDAALRLKRVRAMEIRLANNTPLLPFDTDDRRSSEQYRIIRTKLMHRTAGGPRMCIISSACPADGKTITAINLAGSLSLRSDGDILLVDVDLRRPTIAPLLGLPELPGLAEVLVGQCALEDALVRVQNLPTLYVLPAGKAEMNPAELLDSARWSAVCGQFREYFQLTLLDTPPITGAADYELVQQKSDGVVMVVRPDHTSRTACKNAIAAIPREKFLGVILNCVPDWFLTKAPGTYYDYVRG